MPAKRPCIKSSRGIDANATNEARRLVEKNNTVIWRDVRIDDYGIDALLEFFPEGKITGRYMLTQLKGTSNHIEPLKTADYVSCPIKTTTLDYGYQKVLPVLILYVSLEDRLIYYGTLQQAFEYQKGLRDWKGSGDDVTVRLPSSQFARFEDENFGCTLWNLYQEYLRTVA